jgi:hypothetical protein
MLRALARPFPGCGADPNRVDLPSILRRCCFGFSRFDQAFPALPAGDGAGGPMDRILQTHNTGAMFKER